MNKQKLLSASFLLMMMFSFSLVAAVTCSVNGEEVECPAGMGAIFWVIGIVAVAWFVFWLWMLIDSIRFEENHKAMWIVLMIFIQITAIIYYFVAKRKRA